MRTIAIIQARLGSTRLPRKVFADIAGASMLKRVVTRTGRARRLDGLVVATTDLPGDIGVAEWCAARGTVCVRGPSEDVLGRYVMAAETSKADVIVRITADCPLIDPAVIDEVIAAREAAGADYAANMIERSFPDGLDVEVFTRDALARADAGATEAFERAHVTAHIYRHPEAFSLVNVAAPVDRGDLRWTVDTEEDLALARALYAALGGRDDFGWMEALEAYDSDPAIARLNARIHAKKLEEG